MKRLTNAEKKRILGLDYIGGGAGKVKTGGKIITRSRSVERKEEDTSDRGGAE